MRHIDDGALHAYLDGAHDLIDRAGGVDGLVAHLAECEACRARLEAERAVRGRADAILAMGAPRPTELPPFAALEGRRGPAAPDADAAVGASGAGRGGGDGGTVERPTRRSGAWRRMPLAWAATVVLALGAGWIAREMMDTPGGERVSAVSALDQESDTVREPERGSFEARRPGEDVGILRARTTSREAPSEPAARRAPAAAAPASSPADQRPRTRGLAAGIVAEETAGNREREGRGQERARVAESGDAARPGEPIAARSPAPAAPPPPPAPFLPPPSSAAPPRAREDLAVTGAASETESVWHPVDRVVAEAAFGRPILTVAGLPVIAVERPAAGPGTLIRVRQRLESGEVLTLEQSMEGLPPSSGGEAAAASARTAESAQLAAPSAARAATVEIEAREEPGGSWIELRDGDLVVEAWAPVPLARLRELLARLQ